MIFRHAEDPWLWDMDWSVQDVRTKKPKPPKKKGKTKKVSSSGKGMHTDAPANTVCPTSKGGITTDVLEDEMIDDNNIEVVEGLKNSSDILATIPPAEDVMYKRRQKLPGYPK